MRHWYLEHPARVAHEVAAIEALLDTGTWLLECRWSLAGELCLEAVIRAHDQDYAVRMTYPPLFPGILPIIRPARLEPRWSGHQYGPHGELCLEWGPDNWHPGVTGAQMLESAHRLLLIENPHAAIDGQGWTVAPSRHTLSIGQELVGKYGRYYIGNALRPKLASLTDGAGGKFLFSTQHREVSWIAFVYEITIRVPEDRIIDPVIPRFLRESRGGVSLREGAFIRTTIDPASLRGITRFADIEAILMATGYVKAPLVDLGGGGLLGLLIIDRTGDTHMFIVFDDGGVLALAPIVDEAESAARAPQRGGLASVRVGIVGLVSAGSKIAVSLARMGIRSFFLIDHDVFLPGNIARNALDWGNVGEHKVDAVLAELGRISAGIDADVSHLHLTGQESTAVVSNALEKLGGCDLIIDATANPTVFGVLAAVAMVHEKPLVWLAVYAGGIGGLIARSRPGLDIDPWGMQQAYRQYCDDHPAPELQHVGDYSADGGDGEVLVASDADVAIIAAHAARLAVDTVSGSAASYPHSLYLIGLAARWVFTAPFHTIPIATDYLRHREVVPVDDREVSKGLLFVTGLQGEGSDAAATPA